MSFQLASPTLQNLLTEVRMMLRQRDPSNSTWLDDELTMYINEAVRVYFLEAVLANEGYFTKQTGGTVPDLNIVSGSETIALPADCFQIKNVWKKVSDGWISLPYDNAMNESYSTQGGTSDQSWFPSYYFQENSLVFRPTPNFSQTGGIRLEYTYFPDQMVYGGDMLTAEIAPIFKQVLVMYAVYKAKLSESLAQGVDLYSAPFSNLAQLVTLFRDAITKRSKFPTSVQAFNPEFD